MDIVITGRRVTVPQKFRDYAEDKLSKVDSLVPKAQRLDVELHQEQNPRQSDTKDRVELTLLGKGPVVRAEASASDKFAAFDLAYTKLMERVRRLRDRRKDHRTRRQSVGQLAAEGLPELGAPALTLDASGAPVGSRAEEAQESGEAAPGEGLGESPVIIREKVFAAEPMTVDDALYYMELVGHDFYLFVDAETGRPSVVYRRRGWDYGVIGIDTSAPAQDPRLAGDHTSPAAAS